MSDWNRSTRESTFENLRPELQAIIRKHFELHGSDDAVNEIQICVETTSEKVNKGLFGNGETVYNAAILTSKRLIIASSGTKVQAGALSAKLNEITVTDYEKSPFNKMIPDTGLNIEGALGGPERSSTFLPLDKSSAAAKFHEALQTAIK